MGIVHWIVDHFLHLDKHLADASHSLGWKLYALLAAIVFCETGLVVTPFLPGDSLLFALGAVAALETSNINLPLAIALLCLAANCGDLLNYTLGYHVGPRLFSKERSFLFNRRHLDEAHRFYERYGTSTIILARFVPIIRTFAPFVAGIGKMRFVRFALFSISGGALWVILVSMAGYYFGQREFVKKNFEIVILAIIAISVVPAIIQALRARKPAPTPPAIAPAESSG